MATYTNVTGVYTFAELYAALAGPQTIIATLTPTRVVYSLGVMGHFVLDGTGFVLGAFGGVTGTIASATFFDTTETIVHQSMIGVDITISTSAAGSTPQLLSTILSGDDTWNGNILGPDSGRPYLLFPGSTFSGFGGNDTINLGDFGNTAIDGGSGNDILNGGAGADELFGNSGNDLIDGKAGNDTLTGGSGDDTYVLGSETDAIIELAAGGTHDTIASTITRDLSALGYEQIEDLILDGSGNIDGTGNALDNFLTGNSGDNALEGATGSDTLSGGAGNDTYILASENDRVVELADGGTADTVTSTITRSLDSLDLSYIENLILLGIDDIGGTGNSLDNTIIGNTGANTLRGYEGVDSLVGGAGNDTYIIDDALDTVTEVLDGGDADTVQTLVSYTLRAGDSIELLQAYFALSELAMTLVGSNVGQTIIGNAGANFLNGGAGADTLKGLAGNDDYQVDEAGDTIVEEVGGGFDRVGSATIDILLASYANVESAILIGTLALSATGTDANEVLSGILNSAANVLTGLGGDDFYDVGEGDTVVETANGGFDRVRSSTIDLDLRSYANVEGAVLTGSLALSATGTNGNDVLLGTFNSAANVLIGLDGDDDYTVSDGDTVVETADGGIDTVDSATLSLDLANYQNVENAGVFGNLGLSVTGTSKDNVLRGDENSAANILKGLAGNDSYVVGAGDTVIEAAGAAGGIDEVASGTININLASYANVENITLFGSLALNATGNAGANAFYAFDNTAANVLRGLGGNDSYYVGAGDKIVEAAGGGTDAVASDRLSLSLANFANVENVSLYGSAALSATGSTGHNILFGESNTGANLLRGLSGNDTYVVGIGDRIAELGSGGRDIVASNTISLSLVSYANVEDIQLLGTIALNATGNAGVNSIVGNLAANTLRGGLGRDTFVFSAALSARNVDKIADYSVTDDTIQLENTGAGLFTSLALGTLSAQAFVKGAGLHAGRDASDRIVYDTTTGDLYYDKDGLGGAAAVKFATLTTHPLNLTNLDFFVS